MTKIMRAAASPNPGGQQCFSASPTIASKPVGFGMRASSPGGPPMQCQGPGLASQGMTSPTALQAVQQPVQQLVQVGTQPCMQPTMSALQQPVGMQPPQAAGMQLQLQPVAPQPMMPCMQQPVIQTVQQPAMQQPTMQQPTMQQPAMQQPAMQQPTMQPQAYHPALQQEMQAAMPLSMQQPLLSHDMIQPTMQPMPPMQPMQPTVQPLQQALQQVSPAPQSQQVVMQPTVQWGQGALQQPMPQAMQPHLDQPELAFMQAPQAPATATAAYPEYECLGWFFAPRDGGLSKWRKQRTLQWEPLDANVRKKLTETFFVSRGHQLVAHFPFTDPKVRGNDKLWVMLCKLMLYLVIRP